MYLPIALASVWPVLLVACVLTAWIGYFIGRYVGHNPRRH